MDVMESGNPVNTQTMTVGDLLTGALAEVARQDNGPLPHLTALHERPTPEVYDTAVRLLHDDDETNRELGARILRELGPENEGSMPFSPQARAVLTKRLSVEPSFRVIGWIISALGYNAATEELRTIASFAEHEDSFVRFHVAAAIPGLIGDEPPAAEIIAVLERMLTDQDADVRFYAAYALLEEIAGVSKQHKKDIAARLVEDEDDQVRTFAQSWITDSSGKD
ncbi:HEAT repeat domain-containing protein [Micromonosporaceae bacterium Da 78-11]